MPDITPNPPTPMSGPHDVRPIPDPTVLTTQQLLREIAGSREVIEKQFEGIKHVFETRITALEKSYDMFRVRMEQRPAEVASEVNRLQELHAEKFNSIQTQFAERDTRTEQTSRDSKVAVDAALQAAKEAVGEQNKSNAMAIAKSEATFTKQIDQIGVLVTTMQKAIDDKIDDLKSRITAIEASKKGGGEVWALLGTLVGLAIGVAGAAAAFYRR